MQVSNLTVETAAVLAGAWLVVRGDPTHGLLWLVAGVYLHKTNGGDRD